MTDDALAPPEITTVGPDMVVAHRGTTVIRVDDVAPGETVEVAGASVRTLPDPGGELLSRFGTVNDVHFGETKCGHIDALAALGGPVLSVEDGEEPYPITMNRGAIEEMTAADLDAVVVKGDLTADGTDDEYRAFLDLYEPAFGDRLVHVRGNHDSYHGGSFAAWSMQLRDLPGARLLILDTAVAGRASGTVTDEQIEWVHDMAAESDRPVILFGHHHVWDPSSDKAPEDYFGVHPARSKALVDAVARHPQIVGYFAGHTHRNRVRRFRETGPMPWVEVACVKDFPGAWAEYRVHEGGIAQIHHRISSPAALVWTERTRAMFGGLYPSYSFGELDDRCFVFGR